MFKIYILGSSGFIGEQLLVHLNKYYAGNVITVGRKECDVYVDLNEDYSELVNLVTKDDFVVFLSSISSPDICNKQPEMAHKVNVESSIDLINKLTEKGTKVIFSSTDVVFGNKHTEASDHSDLAAFGQYGDMKAAVENAVFNNNLVKVIRFSYVLGEGDKYTSMLKQAAISNELIEVFDGFERNVVVIDDVLEGINKLILNWERIKAPAINFSGNELISRQRITELFAKHVDENLHFCTIDAPTGFWNARPKVIAMTSNVFSHLLEKQPMTIEYKLQHWSIK
jgi:dTDP-4-dehydrorhamnose reductase